MTTSRNLSEPRGRTYTWSEVDCRTRFCQRCKKIPFDEEAFDGFVPDFETGEEGLILYPNQLHDPDEHGQYNLRIDFELVDNWPQLHAITRSAENCDFCKLLETRLRKTELPPEFCHAQIRVELFYCWRHEECISLTGLKALVYGKRGEEDKFTRLVWLTFMIDADEGECKRWLRIRQRPASDFLCGANITQITTRLKQLDNKEKSTFLPTRLIDLGCHDRSSTFGRLVTKEETYDERCTSPMYVALSYPWGSPEQAAYQSKTTPENIYDRMTSVDLHAVSRVIQDAATVCKLLGVRYLWVDALCIIQGDIKDWERESTEMGSIFRNAYLTIGAGAIDSCHKSFLSLNVDALDIPFQSRIEKQVKGTYRLIAGNDRDGKDLCILETENFSDTFWGPWMTRGWVFQEVAMSSRLLMFERTTVTLNTFDEENEGLPLCFNVFQDEITFQSWRDLVGDYSGRRLTFQKDTLPAISGLARLFEERIEDQYLAGIWRNDLFISLFWYHPPPPYLKRLDFSALINTIPSRPFIAPSWSWAAERSNTEFGMWGFHSWDSEYESKMECYVIDAQCTVEGLDPFGIVKSGYIILSAKVLRLQEGQFSFTPTPGWQNGHYDWYVGSEARVMQTFLDGHPESNDPDIHRVLFLLLGSCNDYGMEAMGKFRDDGATNGERCAYGLVLYPAQGPNTFYRVGLFNSQVRNHAPDGGLKFCDNWKTEEITII